MQYRAGNAGGPARRQPHGDGRGRSRSGFAGVQAPRRIADLHADVELLRVECAATRHNLLECLKKFGHLELGDRKVVLSEIKNEMMMGQRMPFVDSSDVLEKMQHDAENGRIKGEKEQIKLMAEIEFQGRLDSARAESDRRKADFLKKVRLLHQTKLELAEAEAEYKSSR